MENEVTNACDADWRLLCEAAPVWTLLLNKRRSNEVALIKTSSFVDRPKWSETANQDIVSTFNDSEKQLLKR